MTVLCRKTLVLEGLSKNNRLLLRYEVIKYRVYYGVLGCAARLHAKLAYRIRYRKIHLRAPPILDSTS